MEKIILLQDSLDTPTFYGVNNGNILCLKNQHPEVRVVARGYQVKVAGSDAAIEHFEQALRLCENFCIRNNRLTEQDILMLLHGDKPHEQATDNLILHGVNGKSIYARSENQKALVKAYEEHDLLFAVGLDLRAIPADFHAVLLAGLHGALPHDIPPHVDGAFWNHRDYRLATSVHIGMLLQMAHFLDDAQREQNGGNRQQQCEKEIIAIHGSVTDNMFIPNVPIRPTPVTLQTTIHYIILIAMKMSIAHSGFFSSTQK